MKKFTKILILLGILICGGTIYFVSAQNISSRNYRYNNVPNYYYANYKFADSWDDIWNIFNTVKARNDLGMGIDTSYFRQLYLDFSNSFRYLTTDYSITYEKCTALARELSYNISNTNLQAILWNSCYKWLTNAVSNINSNYTVRASVTSNPSQWLAPLTVTFDARNSIDPSSETIPTNNFFWYYRDENGVDTPIGEWQVITHTFNEPGKFIVHLVVRSSNVNQWILDWEKDITINVSPKAANIVVYANTRKMSKDTPLKIWISEWAKWVVFDGSATMPRWERKILSHRWTITNSSNGFSYSKAWEWAPGYINVPLEWNGEFRVTLTTKDNENNSVSETFYLYMSDPVTIIKQTPEIWNTSTTFNFDGSASYSITNRLNTYIREIFDENWDKIVTEQWKRMGKVFYRPWNYLIRLTVTDVAWNTNVDFKDLYVESTIPTPQFSITPTSKRTNPSEFTLDASNSSDKDVLNNVDALEYDWKFSTEKYSIISSENDNQKIIVQFNEVWKHTIQLTVRDQYGKISIITKDIEVKSILRPEIEAIPWAITRWKTLQFKSTVNAPVINYVWNYWDWTNTNSQYATNTSHIYSQKWIYTVTLTVYDMQWNSNTVTEKVFIWEIEYPIAAYRVKDNRWFYIQASDSCIIEWEWGVKTTQDAYTIDRYKNFTIDPSISVNSMWNSNGLKYVFEKESLAWLSQAVTNKQQYNDNFKLVWCHYVDLTIQDSNIWKQDKVRIRFNVKNAEPTIQNVTLSFPQYSNNNSIGFPNTTNSNNVQFDCSWTNNLTVKVTAVNANDSDGSISRLKFYYYNAFDPDRILGYKDTRISTPYAYFIIPRITWEYKFWVMVYDNDEWMTDSKDALWSNPSIYFPASCDSSEIPTVSLKVSSQNIEVWDTVTFSIASSISSYEENFKTDRTFYYDFEWDWVWDLVTKKDTVTYTFTEPYENWVKPRAAVEYRGKLWIWDGATILVKNWVKPILLYNSYKNTVIFKDMSIWTIQQRQICFEEDECKKWNTKFQKTHIITTWLNSITWWTNTTIKQHDSFIYKYSDYWSHNVSIYVQDKHWISVKTWFTVKTSSNTSNGHIAAWVNMITIPETTFNNSNPEVFLSKVMNNTLLIYINYENEWTCYVDTDISTDSNGDGEPNNDVDITCNNIAKIVYQPNYESAIWRIYFTENNQLMFKNFYVTFEWYILELDEEKLEIYKDITLLINWIEDTSIDNIDLKNYLDTLRKNLNSTNISSSLVATIQTLLDEWGIKISASQKERLDSILDRLSNWDTIVAVWMNEYEKNKLEILAILPSSLKPKIEWLFSSFEENISAYDPEKKAQELQNIQDIITKEWQSTWWLDEKDIALVIQPSFCNIFEYYDILRFSSTCGMDTITETWTSASNDVSQPTTDKKNGLPKILKIILICLVIGLLTMWWIIVFFSIKARINSKTEEDEE